VLQSNDFNASAIATTVVAAMTSNTRLAVMPGNVSVPRGICGLDRESVVNVSAIATIDKTWVTEDAGALPLDMWQRVAAGLRLVLQSPFTS
jgi:mRNA interferase MazF